MNAVKEAPPDTVDGFLRYDVIPENSFKARGWEHDPKFTRPVEVRVAGSKPIRTVAWNSDGTRLATGAESGGLRIWDARVDKSGVVIDTSSTPLPSTSKTTNPHTGNVTALAWSATDPNTLVSGCKGGGRTIAVWDVSKPSAPVATFNVPVDVLHLAFHPIRDQFAAVCPQRTRDEVFFYWKVERDGEWKWEERKDVMIGGVGADVGVEEINSLRFWSGGDSILGVSNDGSLTAWWYPVEERPPLPPSEDEERRVKKPRLESPTAEEEPVAEEEVVEEREGEREEDAEGEEGDRTQPGEGEAAAGEGETQATEVDGEGNPEPGESADTQNAEVDESKIETLEAPDDNPTGDKPDEESEIAPEADAKDTPAGDDVEMAEPAAPSAPASAAPSAPASAAPSAAPTAPASPAKEEPPAPSSPPKDDAAAKKAAEAEKKVAEAEGRHRQLQQCFRKAPATGSLLSLALNPRGTHFAVGGTDARVSLIDARNWIVEKTYDQPTAAIRQIAFSPNGEFIAVGGDDSFIFILGAVSRTTVDKIPVASPVYSLSWHPKRNVLAYCTKWKSGAVSWSHVSEVREERKDRL